MLSRAFASHWYPKHNHITSFLLKKILVQIIFSKGFYYFFFLFLFSVSLYFDFKNAYKAHFSSQVPRPQKAHHNFSQISSNLHFLPIAALILKFNRDFYEFEHNGDKNRQSTGCSSGLLCRRAWSCYLSLDPHCFPTLPLQGEMYP